MQKWKKEEALKVFCSGKGRDGSRCGFRVWDCLPEPVGQRVGYGFRDAWWVRSVRHEAGNRSRIISETGFEAPLLLRLVLKPKVQIVRQTLAQSLSVCRRLYPLQIQRPPLVPRPNHARPVPSA